MDSPPPSRSPPLLFLPLLVCRRCSMENKQRIKKSRLILSNSRLELFNSLSGFVSQSTRSLQRRGTLPAGCCWRRFSRESSNPSMWSGSPRRVSLLNLGAARRFESGERWGNCQKDSGTRPVRAGETQSDACTGRAPGCTGC